MPGTLAGLPAELSATDLSAVALGFPAARREYRSWESLSTVQCPRENALRASSSEVNM